MPGSWGVIKAPQPSAEGQTDEMKQYGQMNRMNQPGFYQKEEYKEEHKDEDMLPGQKMYYMQSQASLSGQENALRSKMYDYFSKSQNIPSSDMQQQWNKELMDIEQNKMKLQAESSMFKDKFKLANELERKLYEGGEASTANRIALTDDNGVYVPTLGQKDEGGYGWMTGIEALKGLDFVPGERGGVPVHAGLDTPINYTGEFRKHVNAEFAQAGKSKEAAGIPQYDANGKLTYVPQVVSDVYGTENMSYLNVLTRTDDAPTLRNKANVIMNGLSPTAKLDLSSQFYENLLHAQQMNDGTISFPMDLEDGRSGEYQFKKEESGTLMKLLHMQKLDGQDKANLNKMIHDYGKDLILSQIPGRTSTVDATEHIKVKDAGTGEGNVIKGGFTQIATGKAEPTGPAIISYKEGNIPRKQFPGVVADRNGNKLQLNQWQVPISNVSEFNKDAVDFLTHQGGIMPDHFSNGINFFYTEDGVPNSMSIFQDSGARIVGTTGTVQENLIPQEKKGEKGYDLDLFDVRSKPIDDPSGRHDDIRSNVIKTIGIQMAIPEDSPYFKGVKTLNGVEMKKGVDKDTYPQREYFDEYSGGKKAGKKPFRIVTVWMPVSSPDVLYQFENKEYAKGTQAAQAKQAADKQQQKTSGLNESHNDGNLK